MPNFSKSEIVLVRYPFSDLTNFKVRPAVIVNAPHVSKDLFIVALTSKTQLLMSGEFVLSEWQNAGLNVATAVKRGVFTIHEKLVLKVVGKMADTDAESLDKSLRGWFDLK
jgi:mRNA interferase MazF